MSSRIRRIAGSKLWVWPTTSAVPLRSKAAIISSQSSSDSAIGFSTIACLSGSRSQYRVLAVPLMRRRDVDGLDIAPLHKIDGACIYRTIVVAREAGSQFQIRICGAGEYEVRMSLDRRNHGGSGHS